MSWSPTNLDQHDKRLDNILHIDNLHKLLSQCVPAHAYCNLNLCINGLRQKHKENLNGYDLYVLGIWFEVFDDLWFYQVYQSNPQAEFLILTDLDARDLSLLPRVKVVNLLQWKYWYTNYKPTAIDWASKTYKLSSLSNRITQYRYFISAALLNRDEALCRWNMNHVPGNFDQHIYKPAGWPKRDRLLALHKTALSSPVNAESFINDPVQSINQIFNNPAYANSLVNSINENKDVTWTPNLGVSPGPYMTEKTWKPIMAGCALLFSGAYGTMTRLEQIGFNFSYPWSNEYDKVTGDLARLEQILDTIDTILGMQHEEIAVGIKDSVEHNQNILVNGQVSKYIEQTNQSGFDQIIEYFT